MTRRWLALLLLVVGCEGGPDRAATTAELTTALAAAGPGTIVELMPGRYEGRFRIPAGVTLRGAGVDNTVLASDMGQVVSVETAAGQTTVMTGIRVESRASAGVVVGGEGDARLEDLEVDAMRGVALGMEGVAGVTLRRIRLAGPVTRETAVSAELLMPDPATTATHGLVALRVGSLTMEDISIRGFALYAVLLVDSTTSWTTGAVQENLGTGIATVGGTSALTSVEVSDTLQGLRLWPVYGAVFMDGSATLTDLTVHDSEGLGVGYFGASGRLEGLTAYENDNAAVWIQDSTGVSVEGATITNNSFIGTAVVSSSMVTISSSMIARTRSVVRPSVLDPIEVGDGVQAVASTDLLITGSALMANERAGLLADLDGGDTTGLTFTDVDVTASGMQLGAVVQAGTITAGWDDGVNRMGDAAPNDTAFQTAGIPLDVVMVVTPTDLPEATSLRDAGLSVLGVVTPTD